MECPLSKPTYPASPYTYQDYPFLQTKYYDDYIRLMLTRQALNRRHIRNISKTHRHHMLPVSLGGPDTKANKVVLTWKEHLAAHLLLVRITEGEAHRSMVYALWRMCQCSSKNPEQQTLFAGYRGSRLYAANMEAYAEARKGWHHTPESIKRLSLANLGKKRSTESIEKTRQANLGKTRSPDAIERSRQGNLGKKTSNETKEKQRQAKLGKKQSTEAIEKRRLTNTGQKRSDKTIEKMQRAALRREKSHRETREMRYNNTVWLSIFTQMLDSAIEIEKHQQLIFNGQRTLKVKRSNMIWLDIIIQMLLDAIEFEIQKPSRPWSEARKLAEMKSGRSLRSSSESVPYAKVPDSKSLAHHPDILENS